MRRDPIGHFSLDHCPITKWSRRDAEHHEPQRISDVEEVPVDLQRASRSLPGRPTGSSTTDRRVLRESVSSHALRGGYGAGRHAALHLLE